MIDTQQLLTDLKGLVIVLVDDLRKRSDDVAALGDHLRREWTRAREGERTAQAYEQWREDYLAQAAVMWVLCCVFVRFLEDNGLVSEPSLAGPGERLRLARDRYTLYFQQHALESDREYLYDVFRAVEALPAAQALFDERHNPIWTVGISGDAATKMLNFWQAVVPETGALARDFTDPSLSTRFLGDLYQDLSASARKKYALLQTPDFVLQFILDRTLTPALDEFGLREVRLIDPACGSGHFLLEAFGRLFRTWSLAEPAVNRRELAQRALDGVYGVDVNPFAAEIARFRLLLAALMASSITRLADAPAFRINVAAGDSLLHGPRPKGQGITERHLFAERDPLKHVYETEDAAELARILGQRYHVVVGNPPYITPKDAALNKAYRGRFDSCHMKYSLAVPFMERMFDLAVEPDVAVSGQAGYIGMITASSFMKRGFGKKIIEHFFPLWDLTHVIDTDKAQIPGHGTGTAILLGRHRPPVTGIVRLVSGLRKEEPAPVDASQGKVWTAIASQIDSPGSVSEFVSVANAERVSFHRYPWSIGGGGAAELKERLEAVSESVLADVAESVGFMAITGEDEAFLLPNRWLRLQALPVRQFSLGDQVRDWGLTLDQVAVFPYREEHDLRSIDLDGRDRLSRYLWPLRARLRARSMFGKSPEAHGFHWYDYMQFIRSRAKAKILITFAEVATHNHFVLSQGTHIFNQTAPVITFPNEGSSDDLLPILGVLNSSVACFWLRQVCHDKGAGGIGGGIASEDWEHRFAFNATNVLRLPLATVTSLERVRAIVDGSERSASHARSSIARVLTSDLSEVEAVIAAGGALTQQLVSLQEELDWHCYDVYGLLDDASCVTNDEIAPLELGQRPFEIRLARKIAKGELQTTWFERHGATPVTEIPTHWSERYRSLVERRILALESNPDLALIEQPEYKRRWNVEPWERQVERALRDRLLDRLEAESYWSDVGLTTVARLADRTRKDDEFMRVAALYRKQDTFDLVALVSELVASEAVPFLPVLRYKAAGLRKRGAWERTWDLQRQEDAIDARASLPEGDPRRLSEDDAKTLKAREVGTIPVPPRYASTDFVSSTFWRLRGKLDVPKERFISYPFCERDVDQTQVVAWAGWDHLQQERALATYYVQMREAEGWSAERLTPLLAGMLELLPWLHQWHNEIDLVYSGGGDEYFEGFVDEELRALGLTRDDARAWIPPRRPARRRRR